MNPVSYDNIHELLDRFFDGSTTCAEEMALEEYFASGAPVPPDCEQYRAMFGWYASGMDESRLPHAGKPARRRLKAVVWIASAAAALTLLIGFGWTYRSAAPMQDDPFDGSYIVRSGRMITGEEEIKGDIAATLLEGQCLDAEIDRQIAMMEKEQKDLLN